MKGLNQAACKETNHLSGVKSISSPTSKMIIPTDCKMEKSRIGDDLLI